MMKISSFFPLIGIAIFVYILINTDVNQILSLMYNISLFFLGLVFVFMFPILFIKVFKWEILLRTYGIKYPFWKLFKAWMMGFSISLITPARVGDFSRAYLGDPNVNSETLETLIQELSR